MTIVMLIRVHPYN